MSGLILTGVGSCRNSTDVFLIIAQGRFAARAWPGVALPSSSGPGTQTWAFDLSSSWVWLFAADIEEWFSIDITWARIPCSAEAGRFGYVVAQECPSASGARVPAIVDAFLDRGRHRLIRPDRRQFCEELAVTQPQAKVKYEGEATEACLFRRLLHQHARLGEMLEKLSAWWKAEAKRTTRRSSHKPGDDSGSEPAQTSSDDDPGI